MLRDEETQSNARCLGWPRSKTACQMYTNAALFRTAKLYQFNEKDKTLRVFLRGRPIVHHTPDDYRPGISVM